MSPVVEGVDDQIHDLDPLSENDELGRVVVGLSWRGESVGCEGEERVLSSGEGLPGSVVEEGSLIVEKEEESGSSSKERERKRTDMSAVGQILHREVYFDMPDGKMGGQEGRRSSKRNSIRSLRRVGNDELDRWDEISSERGVERILDS